MEKLINVQYFYVKDPDKIAETLGCNQMNFNKYN